MHVLTRSCLFLTTISITLQAGCVANAMTAEDIAAQLIDISPRARTGVVEEEWERPDITCTPIDARGVFHADRETVVRRPRVQLEINFAFGSDELTRDALELIDQLAEALESPMLRDTRFLLVGHTDAVGSQDANMGLSKRRAETVFDRLTQVHGIAPERLLARGCGERMLLDRADTASPRNRRVEVVNAGR